MNRSNRVNSSSPKNHACAFILAFATMAFTQRCQAFDWPIELIDDMRYNGDKQGGHSLSPHSIVRQEWMDNRSRVAATVMLSSLSHDRNSSEDQPIAISGLLPYLLQMMRLPSLISAVHNAFHSATGIYLSALRAIEFFVTHLHSKNPAAAGIYSGDTGAQYLTDLHTDLLGESSEDLASGAAFSEDHESMPWDTFHLKYTAGEPSVAPVSEKIPYNEDSSAHSPEGTHNLGDMGLADASSEACDDGASSDRPSMTHTEFLSDGSKPVSHLDQGPAEAPPYFIPCNSDINNCCMTRDMLFQPAPVCELREQPVYFRQAVQTHQVLQAEADGAAAFVSNDNDIRPSGILQVPSSWFWPWTQTQNRAQVMVAAGQEMALLLALLACIAVVLYLLELSTSRRLRAQLLATSAELARVRRLQLEERQLHQSARAADSDAHCKELQEGVTKWTARMDQLKDQCAFELETLRFDHVKQLEEQRLVHEVALDEALQDHDQEMKVLSSSHAEAVRALRYHLYITRGALRKMAGRVHLFKKQLVSEFAEVRLSVRNLHSSLQDQSEALMQQRRVAAASKEAMLRQALESSKQHMNELERIRQEKVSELENFRIVNATQATELTKRHEQQLLEQSANHVLQLQALGQALVVHRTAARRFKVNSERAFYLVRDLFKERLGQIVNLASRHARDHQVTVHSLEDQLGVALKKGQKLRQHVKELQADLTRSNEQVLDHVSSLEDLVERMNSAEALIRVKDQQILHDRDLRNELQGSLQAADEREKLLEQQISDLEADMRSLRQECSSKDERITELENAVKTQQSQLAEVPMHLDKMRLAKEKIKDLMDRLRIGQQQLEDLQRHVAERDVQVAKLEAERQAAEAAVTAKEKHLEESFMSRHKLHQLELAAKAQELKHRLSDIDLLKDELRKVRDEVKSLRKPRQLLPSDPRALQQISANNHGVLFKR
ncbi:hypothetical protein CEUSTIGMA_g12962.t1 [Chlamydomonas eustigma]|uniref:Uncharacterized protein n=1 Tax=Chlamydomonas eustigma TaxID=1157962 RepID=A0A250XR51_9CHLO|nr:hypothetical protein CEUSTIGMA_g12962.t1 [Chlamydomonas eustigma]|eukprot:GAX85547.1 hypothetical protein CEUSTIGMA_g12962.t1 [Chlamydomonas eustigma]